MQGHYGSRFLNMWTTGHALPDGQDAGLVNAMYHWAEKLGWYSDHPESIKHVLDHLPEDPPTLPQFVNLCRTAPRKEAPMLEHKLTEEQMAENKRRVADLLASLKK